MLHAWAPNDMKLHSILRRLSIVCYLFIFIKGMIIAFPFILVLAFGIPNAYPVTRIFLILADLGLIYLAVSGFTKKTRAAIALQILVYFLLLSPLVWTLATFPWSMFDYALFYLPFGGFVLLYPLSVLFSWLANRQR